MSELKNCPHCGKSVQIEITHQWDDKVGVVFGALIHHKDCISGMEVSLFSVHHKKTEQEARDVLTAAWNTRFSESTLTQTAMALELVCDEIAGDDCCPYDSEPEFEEFPECASCIVNNPTGDFVYQDSDRDTACWIRHYMRKAEVTGHD